MTSGAGQMPSETGAGGTYGDQQGQVIIVDIKTARGDLLGMAIG